MNEAQLTNKAALCDPLEPAAESGWEHVWPSYKIPNHMEFYWKDCEKFTKQQ